MRTIEDAISTNNGILFKSKQHKGYVVMTTIDEKGSIETEFLTKKAAEKKDEKMNKDYYKKLYSYSYKIMPFTITPIVLGILYFILKEKSGLVLFAGLLGSYIVLIVSVYIGFLIGDLKKNTKRFHGAEHMVINAYKKLQRVPSISEICHYSRFNKDCGTNVAIFTVIICIAILHCIFFIPDRHYWLLVVCLYNLSYLLLWQLNLLNFFQVVVTETPTQRELEVAIEELKAWLEYEQNAEKE